MEQFVEGDWVKLKDFDELRLAYVEANKRGCLDANPDSFLNYYGVKGKYAKLFGKPLKFVSSNYTKGHPVEHHITLETTAKWNSSIGCSFADWELERVVMVDRNVNVHLLGTTITVPIQSFSKKQSVRDYEEAVTQIEVALYELKARK